MWFRRLRANHCESVHARCCIAVCLLYKHAFNSLITDVCCVSVQVSTIEELIKDKKAILAKIENQPLRRCGIPDPFKGSPQVLGKVCVCVY